jgi:hypothetical protein
MIRHPEKFHPDMYRQFLKRLPDPEIPEKITWYMTNRAVHWGIKYFLCYFGEQNYILNFPTGFKDCMKLVVTHQI